MAFRLGAKVMELWMVRSVARLAPGGGNRLLRSLDHRWAGTVLYIGVDID